MARPPQRRKAIGAAPDQPAARDGKAAVPLETDRRAMNSPVADRLGVMLVGGAVD